LLGLQDPYSLPYLIACKSVNGSNGPQTVALTPTRARHYTKGHGVRPT
jgi:hypothetical protein